MQYRIVKHYYRNGDDKVCIRYYIEFLHTTFLGNKKWKRMQETVGGFGDCWEQDLSFKSEEDARERMENLLQAVPDDVIVSLYVKDN